MGNTRCLRRNGGGWRQSGVSAEGGGRGAIEATWRAGEGRAKRSLSSGPR